MNFMARVLEVAIVAPAAIVAVTYAGYRIFQYSTRPPPLPRDSLTYKSVNAEINPIIPEDTDPPPQGKPTIYAIIGGGGFLGSYLVYRLLRVRNVEKIFILNRSIGSSGWLYEGRKEVEFIKTDMTNREDIMRAVAQSGAEVVFLVAAVVRPQDNLPHQYPLSYQVNVVGTENVLMACEAAPTVKYLVHVSSLGTCVGWDTLTTKWWDMDETELPVSTKPFGHYSKTKGIAENMVRNWDGRGFRTVSLRSMGIYGYGDTFTFDAMIGPQGTSVVRNFKPWDYVENVAEALIFAVDAIRYNPESVAGRVFFTNDGGPVDNFVFQKAFEKLRPGKIQVSPLPQFVFFMLCLIGDLVARLGKTLPGDLARLSFSTYLISEVKPTVVNDAAISALGDWRRWTVEESIGRCIYLWELHRSVFQAKTKKE
ncbi:hypothetical protein BJ742DRAFT_765901 [Cladochytrium replicatum]|nr:hypothetical protein BJ742DRAFT_765901 [Cladochytrium replicatum]